MGRGCRRPNPGFGRPLLVADRGEHSDRAVREGIPGWQTLARGSAGCVWRWLHRSVAAPLCLRHLPPPSGGRGDLDGVFTRGVGAEGIRAESSPAEWGRRGSGRPNPGFRRPLLVADGGGHVARGAPLCLRPLPPPSRGERGNGDYAQVSSGGAAEGGGGGRAAAQVGAVGSLPLSRCATAPPRGERLDRDVRGWLLPLVCGGSVIRGFLSWRRRGRTSVAVGGGRRDR